MRKGPPSPLVLLGTAVLAVLEGAQASGAPLPKAVERSLRRSQDEREEDAALLLVPPRADDPLFLAHRSHSSHRSHRSHYSGSSGRSHYSGSYNVGVASAPEPPPRPPRPAHVSLVAYPGGRIFVDGRFVGQDSTGVITLQPGTHPVRVENAYLGATTTSVVVSEGQTGVVTIEW